MTGGFTIEIPAETAAEVVRAVRDRLDPITDEVLAGIVEAEPAYQDSGLELRVLRALVRDNISELLTVLIGRPDSLVPARDVGRVKANAGLPLAGILHAYRLAGLRIWDELVLQAAGSDAAAVVLGMSTQLWATVDRYSTVAAESYRDEIDERERRDEQSRRALLLGLLEGTDTAAQRETIRRTLQLPEQAVFLVAVAELGSLRDDPLPLSQQTLRERGITAVWLQSAEEHIGLVASPSQEAADAALAQMGHAPQSRIGASRPFTTLSGAPEALDQARTAMHCVPSGRVGLARFGQAPLDALLMAGRERAAGFADAVLGGLDGLDARDADILLSTLDVWFACAGSSERASELLHCHRNTVTNRLTRVAELTGRSVADPRESAELYAAVRVRRLA